MKWKSNKKKLFSSAAKWMGLTLAFWLASCLTQSGNEIDIVFSLELGDSLTRYDTINVSLHTPEGTFIEELWNGKVEDVSVLRELKPVLYDGEEATLTIRGLDGREIIFYREYTILPDSPPQLISRDIPQKPQELAAPILKFPGEGAIVSEESVQLLWMRSAEPNAIYAVYLGSEKSLKYLATVSDTILFMERLPEDTTLFWKVGVANGTQIAESEVRHFVVPIRPPTSLKYDSPVAYHKGATIPSNIPNWTGGAIKEFTSLGVLPEGLALDTKTGVLSGTPARTQARTPLVVKGTNAGGESFDTLDIEILPPPDSLNPILMLTGKSLDTIFAGESFADPGATCKDASGRDISDSVHISGTVETLKVGAYKLSYGCMDTEGRMALSISRTIVVVRPMDTLPPILSLKGLSEMNLLQNHPFSDPGATCNDDKDGDLSVQVSRSGNVDVEVLGVYRLTYDCKDSSGNAASPVTRSVTVSKEPDTEAPSIKLIGEAMLVLPLGSEFIDPGAECEDNREGLFSAKVSGHVDPQNLGVSKLIYTCQDESGNLSEAVVRNVSVIPPDLEAPTIILNGESEVLLTIGSQWSDPGATCEDDRDANPALNQLGDVDLQREGAYILKYYCTDSTGKESDTLTRRVDVFLPDEIAPTIELIGNPFVSVIEGSSFQDAGARCIDNRDATKIIFSDIAVNTSNPGEYKLEYLCTDKAGNASDAVTRTVAVEKKDTTPPTITLKGSASISLTVGTSFTDPGATCKDNGLQSEVFSDDFVDTGKPGSYILSYSCTDAAGNSSSTLSRAVKVFAPDETAPQLHLNGDAVLYTLKGASFNDPGAQCIDDEDPARKVFSTVSVNTKITGTVYLTYICHDQAGNASPILSRPVTVVLPGNTLVAHWAANEAQGSDLKDASGNGHNGFIQGATFVPGVRGSGLSFDGIDDWVSINDAAPFQHEKFSVTCWIRKPKSASASPVFSSTSNSNRNGISLRAGSSLLEAELGVVSGNRNSSEKISANVGWTAGFNHVVYSYDKSVHRLYVNGTQVKSLASSGLPHYDGTASRLGSDPEGRSFLAGSLDEVKFFSYALTPSQVAAQYDSLKNASPLDVNENFVAYWKLDADYGGAKFGFPNLAIGNPSAFLEWHEQPTFQALGGKMGVRSGQAGQYGTTAYLPDFSLTPDSKVVTYVIRLAQDAFAKDGGVYIMGNYVGPLIGLWHESIISIGGQNVTPSQWIRMNVESAQLKDSDAWYEIVLTIDAKDNSNLQGHIWLNGTYRSDPEGFTDGTDKPASAGGLRTGASEDFHVGKHPDSNLRFTGQISEIAIIKGYWYAVP